MGSRTASTAPALYRCVTVATSPPAGVVERLWQRDPQLPQAFVETPRHVIWPGDELRVVCEFDSLNKTSAVYAGSTHNHEMCNLYAMVYSPSPFIDMCRWVDT